MIINSTSLTRKGIAVVLPLMMLSILLVLVPGDDEVAGERTRSGLTLDYPSYGEEQIILSGNEERVISRGRFGNITLSDNATLKILDEVVINGIVKISGNASLNLTGASMTIEPPPIGYRDNVIRIWDQGSLNIIKDSIMKVYPQPVVQEDRYKRNNASFIEVDDMGKILVEDSTFTAVLPGDAVPEEERVTGGTILITGYGQFISRRSILNAYLNYSVHDDGTTVFVVMERWFWMSIQRFGTIFVEDSEAVLHEPGQTLFKPTNGNIILRNSTIYGNVRPETIATFEITNCEVYNVADQLGYATIHEALEFNDHAHGTVTDSKIIGEIKIGWSSTNEFLGKADNHVTFANCTFDSEKILAYSNTTLILDRCQFIQQPDLEITDNAVLELIDTHLEELVVECGIVEQLVAIKENVTIILDNSRLDYVFNPDPDVIFNFHLKNGSTIDLFQMHFNTEFQNKTAIIILEDGSSIRLNNSKTGVVELILRNSDPPDQELGSEITVKEKFVLEGAVILNGEGLEGAEVSLPLGNEVLETISGPGGKYRFEYIAKTYIESEVIFEIPQSTSISSSYLGFTYTAGVDPYQDNNIDISFEDLSPPEFRMIDRSPKNFNQQKYITISTEISDDGSEVISEVILQYRRPGEEWGLPGQDITMFNVEGDIYRGVLPRSKIGQSIEFRIVAVDGVGNQVVSEKETIEIGREFIIIGWILLAVFILIISVIAMVKITGWFRSRDYLKREFKGDRRTFSDFKRKGVI